MVSSTQLQCKVVLLVDAHDEHRITTKWFLSNFGFAVTTVRTPEEALSVFVPETHGVVVTDNSMIGLTGAELAYILKQRSPGTQVIMYALESPEDNSCLDAIIRRPAHLLRVKEAIEEAFAGTRALP